MSLPRAWLLAFGPFLVCFLAYYLAVILGGGHRNWSLLGPLLMGFACVTNFWQARKLARSIPERVN